MDISKEDWKLLRKKLAEWQEAYMERLVKEYIRYLSGDEYASTKFWNLQKRMNEDRCSPGVQIRLTKSEAFSAVLGLIRWDVISVDDLHEFSDDLQDRVRKNIEMGW